MQQSEVELEVILYGKVQKVGLRAYIKGRAEELGVRGIARNLSDGSVEVLVQGEKGNIEEFLARIKKGSVFSKIEEIEVTWYDSVQDPMEGFSIE